MWLVPELGFRLGSRNSEPEEQDVLTAPAREGSGPPAPFRVRAKAGLQTFVRKVTQ